MGGGEIHKSGGRGKIEVGMGEGWAIKSGGGRAPDFGFDSLNIYSVLVML